MRLEDLCPGYHGESRGVDCGVCCCGLHWTSTDDGEMPPHDEEGHVWAPHMWRRMWREHGKTEARAISRSRRLAELEEDRQVVAGVKARAPIIS